MIFPKFHQKKKEIDFLTPYEINKYSRHFQNTSFDIITSCLLIISHIYCNLILALKLVKHWPIYQAGLRWLYGKTLFSSILSDFSWWRLADWGQVESTQQVEPPRSPLHFTPPEVKNQEHQPRLLVAIAFKFISNTMSYRKVREWW